MSQIQPLFLTSPQVCTHSPLGCTGTMCPAWVSGAGAVQEGHRQCKSQTSFREGATANLEITPHMPVTRTSHPPATHFPAPTPYPCLKHRCWHQPSPHKTPSKMKWPSDSCFTAVCWGLWVWTDKHQEAPQRSPKQQLRQFYPKARRRRGSHPQDVQLQREGAECGKSLRLFADGQVWFVWHLLQTTGRRSEGLQRLLPCKVLLAKGDLYLLLSHRLVKAVAEQSPHNLGTAVQVQVSRGIYFFATSPCEAGSFFPPGSCHTHQFSCK